MDLTGRLRAWALASPRVLVVEAPGTRHQMSSSTGCCIEALISSASKFWRLTSIMSGREGEACRLQFNA